MQGYYIDASALSQNDRFSIDQQLHRLQYIYNPVPPMSEFTFYAEDLEDVFTSLKLPAGCKLTKIQPAP